MTKYSVQEVNNLNDDEVDQFIKTNHATYKKLEDLNKKLQESNEKIRILEQKNKEVFSTFPELKSYLQANNNPESECKIKNFSDLIKISGKTNTYLSKNEYKGLLDLKDKYNDIIKTMHEKDQLHKEILKNDSSLLSKIASLYSDYITLQYEKSAEYLENKKKPAHEEARRIRELKLETRHIEYRNKIMQYKFEYLLDIFPELEDYVDDTDGLGDLHNYKTLNELESEYDRTKNYISPDEYKQLPEEKRDQLALDRYIEGQKSKWQIGRDYELYIGHDYSSKGWDVEYFGIEHQLSDMGRDLIAYKNDLTHIIQCKYWSKTKVIHEKHIAQLYGTTIQYKIFNNVKGDVTPVFVTNIKLSETAKKFAAYLGVKYIEGKDFEEFPRIKCKINKDETGQLTKIYHLPMDQQYDTAKIISKHSQSQLDLIPLKQNQGSDFFAYSVKEAVQAGFRRAYKWTGN